MDLALNEEELKRWSDHIPLMWKYTAGIAGERFLQLLKQGTLQASVCKNCNKLFLPPKIFCKDCFAQLNEWRDVSPDDGFINPGREEPKIGMKVRAVFKPKQERKGSLSDIQYFEKI